MRKKQIHVKSYDRKRHGTSKKGGKVRSHDKELSKEFKTLTNVVEMSQGPFHKKPELIVKDWKYATNHTEEHRGKPVRASVIIDKKALRDSKLTTHLELHELRENQLMQMGLDEAEAHAIAMSYADADAKALNLGNPDLRAMKVYKKGPKIFTDRELNSLKSAQMFGKKGVK